MNKCFLVLLATLPVLSACKSNGGGVVDNGAETILYDENNAETLQLKDVVELTKVIRLEDSDPNSFVASIDELLCVNGVFVVGLCKSWSVVNLQHAVEFTHGFRAVGVI